MKIEFILALEDLTWITEVIEVPDSRTEGIDYSSPEWDAAVIAYVQFELAGYSQYRDVVYWGIYNSDPEVDNERDI